MDLILWRHAEAEESGEREKASSREDPDLSRPLTKRGQKQAKHLGDWLRPRLPPDLHILVSPALRTRQTADALGLPYETSRRLAPDARVADLLAAARWPDASQAVLLIGHQPTLGRLAALLLSGQEANWSIKKGALWWFSNRIRKDETQTVLRIAISPELL